MPYLSALEVFSRSAIQIHVYLYLVVVVAAVAAAAEGSVVGVTLIRGQSQGPKSRSAVGNRGHSEKWHTYIQVY